MSTPNPTHIDVIAKHSLEFSEFYDEWRCRCEHPEARWRGAGISVRPLHAAHVVSKLTDAGYSIVGPSETHVDNGGIKRDSQTSEPYVCEGFAWVGQSFASCEECGRPYWEHSHDRRSGGSDGPFGLGLRLVPITPEQARGCRMKWDPSFTAAAAEGENP